MTICSGVETIMTCAFANTAITELIIPNSVTSITNDYKNTSIVEGCQKLRKVVLGDGLGSSFPFIKPKVPILAALYPILVKT